MKLPELLKEQLVKTLVIALAGLFAFFGAKIYHDVSAQFLAHVLPAISNATLLSACSLLGLLVILLVWWVIYLHHVQKGPTTIAIEKAFDDQFDRFDERLGVWVHKTKDGYFCPNCKARHFESQMKILPNGWLCMIHECKHFSKNPDYQPPQPPGRTRPNWVREV